ncbi:MAG: response regulator [Candidatus Cloacimonetes bacterium]|nr:response regulator [Candidatus Cloacimonadota bacterium]
MGKVLIIDDEKDIRKLIGRFLGKLGYDSDEAANGLIGTEMYKNSLYDFVIMDIIMPEKEGLETLRDLKEINKTIKVLCISGGSLKWNFDYLRTAKLLGAQVTLNKPFDFEEFQKSVEEIVRCDV